MLYSILIYENEQTDAEMGDEEHAIRLDQHRAFQDSLKSEGKLDTVVRLMPTDTARTIKKGEAGLDGPFADTKEQFVGFYVFEADSLDAAVEKSKMLPQHGALEVRPVRYFEGGDISGGSPKSFTHP